MSDLVDLTDGGETIVETERGFVDFGAIVWIVMDAGRAGDPLIGEAGRS